MTAFPEDGDADVESFFLAFPPERYGFVLCEHDTVCTMLLLLPTVIDDRGTRYPAGYIYAGATHPLYRAKGYYKRLLTYVEETAKAEGMAALMLYPATKELSDTYRGMGFTCPLLGAQRPLTQEDTANGTSVSVRAFAAHRRAWMRENGQGFVDWDDRVYAYAANWCEARIAANGQWLLLSTDSERVWDAVPSQVSDCTASALAKVLWKTVDFMNAAVFFGYGLM